MIVVNMVDRDVIERAAALLGGHVYGPLKRWHAKPHYQPIWRAQVNGPQAAAWMMTMYGKLGHRRRGQVRRALAAWRAMRYVRISPATHRSILESWPAGFHNKSGLARRFGVSRETIYRVVQQYSGAWREGHQKVSIFEIVAMTDFDVIARAAELMGSTVRRRTRQADYLTMWLAQITGELAARWIMTIYPWLGQRRRQQARSSLAHWKTQGRGVVSPSLADVIVAYRSAGYAQTQIMRILGVSKSSVYRHTVGRLPRRITRQHMPPEAPPTIPS